jgi:hypothetical protein
MQPRPRQSSRDDQLDVYDMEADNPDTDVEAIGDQPRTQQWGGRRLLRAKAKPRRKALLDKCRTHSEERAMPEDALVPVPDAVAADQFYFLSNSSSSSAA